MEISRTMVCPHSPIAIFVRRTNDITESSGVRIVGKVLRMRVSRPESFNRQLYATELNFN